MTSRSRPSLTRLSGPSLPTGINQIGLGVRQVPIGRPVPTKVPRLLRATVPMRDTRATVPTKVPKAKAWSFVFGDGLFAQDN